VKPAQYDRFAIKVGLAVVSGPLGLLTILWPTWIELAFRVEPDHRSGTLEWILLVDPLVVAVGSSVLARRELRRVVKA
jgi:hypothetical protein